MTLIVKNNTSEEVTWVGQVFAPSEAHTLHPTEYSLWSKDQTLQTAVSSGEAIINTGSDDLDPASGLVVLTNPGTVLLKVSGVFVPAYGLDVSGLLTTSIDSSGLGKVGVDTETINQNLTAVMWSVTFSRNGACSNKWLHRGDVLSNESPYILPFAANLTGLSFSNSKDGSNCRVQIISASEGEGSSSSLKLEWTLLEKRSGRKTSFSSPINFPVGEKIGVYIDRTSLLSGPMNVAVTLYFTRTEKIEEESLEDYSGDIG